MGAGPRLAKDMGSLKVGKRAPKVASCEGGLRETGLIYVGQPTLFGRQHRDPLRQTGEALNLLCIL
jgi:hypothetical protein